MKTTITLLFSIFCNLQTFAILNVPTLLSPINGSTNNAPNEILDWGTSTGATAYQYKLGTIASLAGVNAQTITGSSQVTTSNLLFGTVYYWQVRAIKTTIPADSSDWSAIFNFTTVDFILLVAPTNGALSQAPNEVIDWSALSGVTFYDYQWDTSATFNSPLSNYNSIASGTSQVTTSNLRFGTKYYWRVRARHAADTTQWSFVSNFTTVDFIFLVAPTNGALSQAPNEVIDWSALSGVTFYDYQWDTSATFNSPLSNYNSIASGTSQVTTSNLRFGTKYYWRVRARHAADTTQWSFVSNFTTVDFIFLVAPTNGAINQAPNEVIDWSALSGVTFYDYQWDTSATFNSPLSNYNSIASGTSQVTTSNLRFGTKYYWRVRARHAADTTQWSFVSNFTTIDFVIHVSPINNATGIAVNPIIDWSPISGINGYQYRYSTVANFENPIVNTSVSTTSQATLSNLTFGTEYFWQVRAFHATDSSEWSLPWSFTTLYQLTTAPVLLSPANASNSLLAFGALLEWEAVPSATLYQFQVDDNAQFSSPLFNSTTELSEFTGQLLGETTYYWRVRAGNGSGFSPWSTVWTFTTDIVTDLNIEKLDNIFTVYPNPSNGNFNCKIKSANLKTENNIEIYNLNGKVIQQYLNTDASFLIDLTEFQSGIYFVKLINNKEIITQKIIKY